MCNVKALMSCTLLSLQDIRAFTEEFSLKTFQAAWAETELNKTAVFHFISDGPLL